MKSKKKDRVRVRKVINTRDMITNQASSDLIVDRAAVTCSPLINCADFVGPNRAANHLVDLSNQFQFKFTKQFVLSFMFRLWIQPDRIELWPDFGLHFTVRPILRTNHNQDELSTRVVDLRYLLIFFVLF